jgi:hypothetical protein
MGGSGAAAAVLKPVVFVPLGPGGPAMGPVGPKAGKVVGPAPGKTVRTMLTSPIYAAV